MTTPRPGALLGRRYELLRPLGAGGEGTVFLARDRLAGDGPDEVAVKLLPTLHHRAPPPAAPPRDVRTGSRALRAHVAALARLQIEGVPRLLAQGQEGELAWLAMERARGLPFGPDTADLVAARRLVGVVARLHLAGLLHLDLKPENVLVEGERVHVLDFGVARDRRGGAAGGTPGWMAPEQAVGGPLGPWTDLYSLGLLLRHALGPGHPTLAPLLPRLTSPHPALRPRSAAALLEALGGRLEGPLAVGWRVPVSPTPGEAELRGLVAGPEPFLHLPSDTAARLGGPRRAQVRAALRRLVATGAAEWREGALHLDRAALLRAGRARPVDPDEGEQLFTEGRLDELEARLAPALRTRRPAEALFLLAARTALAQERADALPRALAALAAAPRWTEPLDRAWAVLVGWQALRRGDDGPAHRPIGPIGDEELDAWRIALGLAVREREGRLAEALGALEPWADRPERRARLAGWTARVRYAEGRYAEAAALWEEAAAGRRSRAGRWSALGNAVNAALEHGDLDRAVAVGEAAFAEADAARMVGHAAQLWVRARLARYRRRDPLRPETEHVRAARAVAPLLGALLGLNEAAVAWRGGEPALARRLAEGAAADFDRLGHPPGAALARGLAAAAGSPDLPALAGPPEVVAQAAALSGAPAVGPAGRAALAAWPEARRGRLDVLDAEEAAERLGAARGLPENPPSPR